jgi:hypothetical protein
MYLSTYADWPCPHSPATAAGSHKFILQLLLLLLLLLQVGRLLLVTR